MLRLIRYLIKPPHLERKVGVLSTDVTEGKAWISHKLRAWLCVWEVAVTWFIWSQPQHSLAGSTPSAQRCAGHRLHNSRGCCSPHKDENSALEGGNTRPIKKGASHLLPKHCPWSPCTVLGPHPKQSCTATLCPSKLPLSVWSYCFTHVLASDIPKRGMTSLQNRYIIIFLEMLCHKWML